MKTTEAGRIEFGRQVVEYAHRANLFARFDVVAFLPKETESLGWNGQKELAEDWLDVLVGAGVLEKHGHDYQRAKP